MNTEVRLNGPTMQLARKELEVDYEVLEREDCLQLKEKALGSCSGNNWGFENFLTANANLLQAIFGLVTYVLLLTTVQPLDRAMVCDLQEWLDYSDTTWKTGTKGELDKTDALDIVFDHVCYRYPGAETNVLNDVSFHIKPGEKIALVGINGAGKSTLVKLLCGLYTPTNGRILINGIELNALDRNEYQKAVAPVFQDFVQLSFTIGENVAATTMERIDWKKCEVVLEDAGLGAKIKQLPKGVHTYLDKAIDKEGIELSGGERQKLVLARVLYKQSKLVLLDEPTAAMDSIAETETYQLYGKVLKQQTTLFISHRLASTCFCDRILVLDQGTIAEEGSHEQLLSKQGSYAKMYEVQKQYYVKGGEQDEKRKFSSNL